MKTVIGLLIAAASAYGCYTLAKKNGQNEIIAAVVGFVFPLIGLLVYYLLDQRKK